MPNSGRADKRRRLHPIGGIGWVGVAGILLLCAIAAVEAFSPYGLRFELLRAINANTHPRSTATLVAASTIAIYSISVTIYVSYGVLALLYLLPAFWLAPRERLTSRFVLMPAWCVAETAVLNSPWAYQAYDALATPIGLRQYYEFLPILIAGSGHFVLLWIATKSLRIPITLVILLAVAAAWSVAPVLGYLSLGPRGSIEMNSHSIEFPGAAVFAIAWHVFVIHGVMTIVLIVWALRERERVRQTDRCAECGYSLVGIRAVRCPECGHALPSAPSPIEQREMGEGGVRAT